MRNIFEYTRFTLLTIFCILPCHALDEDQARERRCIEVSTTQNLDFKWMKSVSYWYFPIWHQLELYRSASDMTEESVSSIPESMIATACVVSDSQFSGDGFNRTDVKFNYLRFRADGAIEFMSNSKYAKRGIHYLAHTNNQDFIVGVTCWEDDEASYGIWTTKTNVTMENKQKIWNYLEKLGFDREFMVETPYDKCQLSAKPRTIQSS